MVSLIRTFTYQTFTRFHVGFVRYLFFLLNYFLCHMLQKKQHTTKLIDAKLKFMVLMMQQPLYFY